MRVISSQVSTHTSLGGQSIATPQQPTLHPLSVLLFGKQPPRLVDRRKHPKLEGKLRRLSYVKDQIAEMLGRGGQELSLELCEGANAFISRDGQIALGTELLEEHGEDDDLMVAVLGHEIGHQPWTWPKHLDPRGMTQERLNALYREEEAKADRFAGRVLAELGARPDAICEFLRAHEAFEGGAAPDYFPAEVRERLIRQAFQRRGRGLELRRRLLGQEGPALRELR